MTFCFADPQSYAYRRDVACYRPTRIGQILTSPKGSFRASQCAALKKKVPGSWPSRARKCLAVIVISPWMTAIT